MPDPGRLVDTAARAVMYAMAPNSHCDDEPLATEINVARSVVDAVRPLFDAEKQQAVEQERQRIETGIEALPGAPTPAPPPGAKYPSYVNREWALRVVRNDA